MISKPLLAWATPVCRIRKPTRARRRASLLPSLLSGTMADPIFSSTLFVFLASNLGNERGQKLCSAPPCRLVVSYKLRQCRPYKGRILSTIHFKRSSGPPHLHHDYIMRAFAVLSELFIIGHVHALIRPDGTGRLPALGWSSWNEFECNITEDVFVGVAEKLTSLGLRELGYEYINIDDCWSDKTKRRDLQSKELLPDYQKFPKGISYTADRIHRMGYKLGIYSDAGVYYTAISQRHDTEFTQALRLAGDMLAHLATRILMLRLLVDGVSIVSLLCTYLVLGTL
jgi:hypothetical protein